MDQTSFATQGLETVLTPARGNAVKVVAVVGQLTFSKAMMVNSTVSR